MGIKIERRHHGNDFFIAWESNGREIGCTGDGYLWGLFMARTHDMNKATMQKLLETSKPEECYPPTDITKFPITEYAMRTLLIDWRNFIERQ
jgi:hypothetical protein